MGEPELTSVDLAHLRRCVQLAEEALDAGDEPFGSVLAAADGVSLAEDRNRETSKADQTQHPEFALARQLFRIAKTTSRPPIGRTASAMKPQGSPSLNV